jgi:hypothetical protein
MAARAGGVARAIVGVVVAVVAVMVFAAPALADTGSISGTVVAVGGGCPVVSGCPIAGASVLAFSGNTPVGSPVQTDSSGNYTITALAAGSYAVGFHMAGFTDQYYNNQPSLPSANSVAVTSGATTSGIDAVLQPSSAGGGTGPTGPSCSTGTGAISGQVTSGVTDKPLAGITVQIGGMCGSGPNDTATTDANGNYTVSGLGAGGPYQVSFSGGCCYDPQYYNGQSSTSTATGVTVTANQTTTGISAAMQIDPKWTITGTITDASTGAPLPGRRHTW